MLTYQPFRVNPHLTPLRDIRGFFAQKYRTPMTRILFLLMFCATALVSAQEVGSIAGSLLDKDNNDGPLPFANAIIKGSTKGTTTDFDGNFIIDNVPVGTYTLEFSFVGYETLEIPNVVVEANKVTTVKTSLGASAAALDAVIIKTTVRRESEVALLLDQKKAVSIKQSIGAQELSRKGVSDAAAAVSKISGISKQEGTSNVYVRGLGDRYLNTTYNGLSLPSNDIAKKNINLNLFSSDVIQNISVSKAYATEFYGDFAAGNIDITGKEYTGKFFLDVELGSSTNTRAAGETFLKSEGTSFFGYYNRYDNNPFAVILSHGVDAEQGYTPIATSGSISAGKSFDLKGESRLSFFGTASFSNGFEYREGPASNFALFANKVFPNAVEYEYSTNTTGLLNVAYKVNNKNKIKFNSLFINDSSDEVGYFGTQGQGSNRNAILDTDKGFFQSNVVFEQDLIFVNQLIGEHEIDDKFSIDWGVGYNKVLAYQPDRKRFTLEQYDLALDGDANTNASFFNNIPYDNQRYFQNIEDEELNSRLNLGYKASETVKLNFGYNGRSKERNFKNVRYGLTPIGNNVAAPQINNFNDFFSASNLGETYNTEVFRALDPQNGIDNTNFPGLPENTFKGNLNVHAGYVNAEIMAGEKLTIVPGIRLESFNQEIEYDVINIVSTDPGFRNSYENFLLPSLSLKYALNDEQNLRFSFSKTVSTPEFKEVAPYVYEDVTQQVGGNPSILDDPSFSKVFNLDLKYEWFFGRGELFSVAAFAKQINDPINLVVAADATATQRYFRTGNKAEVLGAEIELRKNILMQDEDNAKLSIGFNATYTYTNQDLKDANGVFSTNFNRTEDELQGSSPFLINADVNYSPVFGNYKPNVSAVFSYFSDRIDALGSGQLGNVVEKAVPTLDLVWRNEIGEHFEINLKALNLLDPTIEYVREGVSSETLTNLRLNNPNTANAIIRGDDTVLVNSANGKGIASYKKGINVGLSLKYKF